MRYVACCFSLRDSRLLTPVLVVLCECVYLGIDRLSLDADDAGRDGDVAPPRADLVVLWDRAAEHPRPDPKGYHALPRQLHEPARAEPARVEPVQARAV